MSRSPREQWMLGIMFTLIAVVVLWLAVVHPIDAARASARERLLEATDRHAAIQAKVKMLKALLRVQASGPAVTLEQFVGQSAAEAGLSLERAQAQGDDRIDIAIGAEQIGRASCRERVCQYVEISVVAGSIKTKPTHTIQAGSTQ